LRGLKVPRRLTAPINSTKQGRRSCKCCTERPALRRRTADTRWRRRRNFRTSCGRPKTRVAELEEEVAAYQERAERAEQWLHRVYTEIEDRFLQQSDSRRPMSGAPQRPQNARRSR
jgi:hypothetical protein